MNNNETEMLNEILRHSKLVLRYQVLIVASISTLRKIERGF